MILEGQRGWAQQDGAGAGCAGGSQQLTPWEQQPEQEERQ